MRIAYATETFLPSVDGVVTRMTHALDRLRELGHEVTIICPDLGCDAYRGFEVVGVPAVRYPVYRSRKWGTLDRSLVRETLLRVRPDVVHVWQPTMVGFAAVLEARRLRLPLVTSYHTNVDQYLRYYGAFRVFSRPVMRLMRWLNNTSPITLVTSQSMMRYLGERGFSGLRVLPRGVDLAHRDPRFRDAQTRARLSGGRPEAPLLLYVGRISAEKGVSDLAPTMRAHPEWSLALVGDGPAMGACRRAFAGTHTTFTGFLTGDELSRAYASADCLVFPSRTETLGLVILESMASGVPVVAARSPATVEQVEDGRAGLVYDPDDPGALERCVSRVLLDRDLAGRFVEEGLRQASLNGWDAASDALVDAYRDTVAAYREGWVEPRHPASPQPPDTQAGPDAAGGAKDAPRRERDEGRDGQAGRSR
jgi:glycosyltransferase involved in cell wall biosynthesis